MAYQSVVSGVEPFLLKEEKKREYPSPQLQEAELQEEVLEEID
jgi:hypothetical protein